MKAEKRNLRPYVLIGCLFWGLATGFVVYTETESAAQRQEVVQQALDAENIALQKRLEEIRRQREDERETAKFVTPSDVTTPENPVKLVEPPPEDQTITQATALDWRSIPPAGKLSLDPQMGLTARLVPPPRTEPARPQNVSSNNNRLPPTTTNNRQPAAPWTSNLPPTTTPAPPTPPPGTLNSRELDLPEIE
jgi:hypothetical protein